MCSTHAVEVESFQASSSRLGNEPHRARLNGNGAWSPSNNDDVNDYLQINLAGVFFICAIATQGNPSADEWTTSFRLLLLFTDWVIYKENGREKVGKMYSYRQALDEFNLFFS